MVKRESSVQAGNAILDNTVQEESLIVLEHGRKGKLVANILIRGLDDGDKHNLMMFAASMGISLNELCLLSLSEVATPFSDLRHAVQERAEEVISDRKLAYERIPRPRHDTQEFRKPTVPNTPDGAIVLRDHRKHR